jgi:SAM-dependent methyltransferase
MSPTWSRIDTFPGNTTSPALTFHRPCPICGETEARTVHGLDGFQFFSDSTTAAKRVDVRQQQCRRCFALFMNPCYSEHGFEVLFAEAGQSYGSTEGRPVEQIEWLNGHGLLAPGRCALDVGCFDGRFLARMPEQVRRIGVDIDLSAIERGRRLYGAHGLELVHGDFESFRCDVAPDAITMFHVLEHLPRPVAVLRKLRSIAHSSTRLVVEVPILENGATNAITGFFTAQHMTHFSRASLQNALARAGWRALEWLEQPDYNGCRVLAAPADATPSTQQSGSDVGATWDLLASWYRAIADVDRRLATIGARERCVIWGGGMHVEYLYQTTHFFRAAPERALAIVDSDPAKQGKSWRGVPIHPPSALRDLDRRETPLVISSYGSQESIARAANELGVPEGQLARLYDRLRIY